MNETQPDQQPEDVEYFGAPIEYADAQEVPEWVSLATKVVVFVPGMLATAATIPLVVLGLLLACVVLCVGLVIAL